MDLRHNDVKQCFRGSNMYCGSCSHERIQNGIVFPRSGKFKWEYRNAGMCSDVAGLLSYGSGNFSELSDRSNKTDPVLFSPLLALLVAILVLIVVTTPILPFGACFVIILHIKTKLITLANHKRNVLVRTSPDWF